MIDFGENQEFGSRDQAFKALQESGYRLWQWMDHMSTVWWGPGRSRVYCAEQPDGTVQTKPLAPLKWEDIQHSDFTVANK